MFSERHTQTENPLGDEYLFEGCVVLTSLSSPWFSSVKEHFPSYTPTSPPAHTSFRAFYFPTHGIWECFIHMNLACVVPRYIITKQELGEMRMSKVNSQIDVVCKYLIATIKNFSG